MKFVCKLIFNYPVTVILTPLFSVFKALSFIQNTPHTKKVQIQTHYMYLYALLAYRVWSIILSRYGIIHELTTGLKLFHFDSFSTLTRAHIVSTFCTRILKTYCSLLHVLLLLLFVLIILFIAFCSVSSVFSFLDLLLSHLYHSHTFNVRTAHSCVDLVFRV